MDEKIKKDKLKNFLENKEDKTNAHGFEELMLLKCL